jgi:hypothetical protein
MTEMLKSIKADLTDRRLLPIVAIVAVAFVAALAYALLASGSSSSPTPSAAASPPVGAAPRGLVVSESQPSEQQAIAETTDGTKGQRRGSARDPFAALPGAAKAIAASTTASTAASASTSSGSSSSTSAGKGSSSSASNTTSSSSKTETSSSGGGGSGSSTPSKPSTHSQPKTIYTVALEFGPLPAAGSSEAAALKSYVGLTKATPLPSAKERLIEFVGVTVTHNGTSAAFAVDGEVILHGSGACLPSATQCQVIDVQQGKTEKLEYLTAAGLLVTDELRVVSIASNKASTASLRSAQRTQARLAPALLGEGGALRAAGLRFGAGVGVLVFAGHSAFGAHASAAHHRGR